MNLCTFFGRTCKDIELSYLPNGGTAVGKFSMAIDKGLSKEKKTEFESQGKATVDFLNFVVWGKQAEVMANYIKKGHQVLIQASVQTGSYNNKEGNKVYTTDFRVNQFEFVGGQADSNLLNKSSSSNNADSSGFDTVQEDDIPF